jgi:hypothetical protein
MNLASLDGNRRLSLLNSELQILEFVLFELFDCAVAHISSNQDGAYLLTAETQLTKFSVCC